MGNISVKQSPRQNKTKRHRRKSSNNKLKNKRRKGGQGSPLNPNGPKSLPNLSIKSNKTKKTRKNKKDESLYSKLQHFKGHDAYVKAKRQQQFEAQRERSTLGSTNYKKGSSITAKRKSI